ncbi:cyanophycin synthetase [Anthocerotibacter panamensis]|uniref:cyanophycin synthetase n=1 Tax=Anthocerotibacter panamensis TaxID=2857077 RepID=UPI001C4022E2|nr:cyanophycin synthetase [Anthocerotibacter panamensis]
MRILSVRALKGPNYWSIRRHNLIVMQLDLEDLEEKPTNELPEFVDDLERLMPSLYSHFCSESHPGGFLKRLKEGIWMGHVVEHVALELQCLAGMNVGFGRTRSTRTAGVYNVVFSYIEEEVGRYAARAAVRLVHTLLAGESYDLERDIQDMREIREEVRFGPSTGAIVDEALSRGIPHLRLSEASLVQLGYGIYQKRVQATTTANTSIIATEIASDKTVTKSLLHQMGIPVPRGLKVRRLAELEEAIADIGGYPVVVKPLDANHGKGITINITDWPTAEAAYDAAKEFSKVVLVEKFLAGKDYRILVINNRLVAVAQRVPAHVIGDGHGTIRQLIDQINQDPRRGFGHEKELTAIVVDDMTTRLLRRKGLTLDSVLPPGEVCELKSTANLSTGGTAIDCTNIIHPDNAFMCERAAQIIGLDVAGIDMICPDISLSVSETGGGIVEVNAAPGFRMHLAPSSGMARNVAEPLIDMLFPPGARYRIPIIAVTGTNGKTTTTRLVAHIIKGTGMRVGFTTTDGVYIQNQLVVKGDMTGPYSAHLILKDPTVEFAVFETARGGILREGLGFLECDIGIVLNVTSDHLGIRDIETLEDLAKVKSVVAEAVQVGGHAILNADDPLVAAMSAHVKAKVAYFTMNPDNPVVAEHLEDGGVAAVYEDGYISIRKGSWTLRVEKASNIPLTLEGKAPFMIQNILPATLACYLTGVKMDDIRGGLGSFIPSVGQTPGRLNFFEVGDFRVLIDYAHNSAGFEALGQVLERFGPGNKIGIFGGPGDRRDEDLFKLGYLGARMFTSAILRDDDDLRGREPAEVPTIIKDGLLAQNAAFPYTVICSEVEAIEYGLAHANKGDLLVILPADVSRSIAMVSNFKEKINPFPTQTELRAVRRIVPEESVVLS